MHVRILTGNTEENNQLTLPAGALSVNTDDYSLRFHDGVTPGGFEIKTQRVVELVPGPGPKVLVGGDINLGYCGLVPAAEFITGSSLASRIGLSAGSLLNDTTPWMKFAYKGKTLYIPQRPIRRNVKWRDIYRRGAVYGCGTFGRFPIEGEETVQDASVTIQGHRFKVRLMRGASTDPVPQHENRTNPPEGYGSEWNDLLYRVSASSPIPPSERWESFTNSQLLVGNTYQGKICWMIETSYYGGVLGKHRVGRGSQGITDYTTNTYDLSNALYWGWRPVLELVAE